MLMRPSVAHPSVHSSVRQSIRCRSQTEHFFKIRGADDADGRRGQHDATAGRTGTTPGECGAQMSSSVGFGRRARGKSKEKPARSLCYIMNVPRPTQIVLPHFRPRCGNSDDDNFIAHVLLASCVVKLSRSSPIQHSFNSKSSLFLYRNDKKSAPQVA